jgi:ABC-type polysaccharide/polyol phosphate export permease
MRFGAAWVVIQPLAQALVLSFVFLKVFKVSVPHYLVYVISGVMAWQCFQQSVLLAATAALDNAPLLKKVAVPATVFPLAAVGAQLIAFSLQCVVILGVSIVDSTLTLHVFLLPVAVLLQTAIAIGIGLAVGSFLPAMRELRVLLETALLMLFYATPVLYDPDRLHGAIRQLLLLNPMAGVMELHRSAWLGRPIDGQATLIACLAAIPLMLVGGALYHRRSGDFADLL